MATIDRGHSGWYLSFHTADGKTHGAFGDLTEEKRAALNDKVSAVFTELLTLWEQLAAEQLAEQEKHTEPGRALQERAAE